MKGDQEQQILASAARSWRVILIFVLLSLITAGISYKLVSLYVIDQDFLQKQGDARTLRTKLIPAHRGMFTDRNGEALAVSAPIATIWANPTKVDALDPRIQQLVVLLGMKRSAFLAKLNKNKSKQFIYVKRQVLPEVAAKIKTLGIEGVHVDREYKRYYPTGEVATHLLGFTGIDGEGQEGLELAYNDWLRGESGKKMVMQDRLGRTIKHIKSLDAAKPGKDIALSIDLRLQYMAYRELKAVVQSHKADSGSAVVLDAQTGEVLAMVNQPAYNPNDRSHIDVNGLRNRAVTDLFEPGSTMKPLTVAAGLMSGKYSVNSIIDTNPGYIRVKSKTIRDHRNYGKLDMTGIITKSSNVAATKITLSLHKDAVRNLYQNVGLGQVTATGFPGERSGSLPVYPAKRTVERATMSYGYGLSVTPLQLAKAYLPFANKGFTKSISLVKKDEQETGKRVMPEKIATAVLNMMETVTNQGGTGKKAAVHGYRVAGKTGTVHKVVSSGYADDKYIAFFAGIVPVSDPRLVIVVLVDNPKGQEYYGGEVAAPVFSRVASGALRLLNVPPDLWPEKTEQKVALK